MWSFFKLKSERVLIGAPLSLSLFLNPKVFFLIIIYVSLFSFFFLLKPKLSPLKKKNLMRGLIKKIMIIFLILILT